jgi:uncharacterized protein (DUF302 family)
MEKVKTYAFSTVLDTSYEDAISRVTDALKEEGFGVYFLPFLDSLPFIMGGR